MRGLIQQQNATGRFSGPNIATEDPSAGVALLLVVVSCFQRMETLPASQTAGG